MGIPLLTRGCVLTKPSVMKFCSINPVFPGPFSGNERGTEQSPEAAGLEEGKKGDTAACSKLTSAEHLLSTGATWVVKGLGLASGSPGPAEELAFLLEGAWRAQCLRQHKSVRSEEGGPFSPLTSIERSWRQRENSCSPVGLEFESHLHPPARCVTWVNQFTVLS